MSYFFFRFYSLGHRNYAIDKLTKALQRLKEAQSVERFPVGAKIMYKSHRYPDWIPATVVSMRNSHLGSRKVYKVTCDNDPYGDSFEVYSQYDMRLLSEEDAGIAQGITRPLCINPCYLHSFTIVSMQRRLLTVRC